MVSASMALRSNVFTAAILQILPVQRPLRGLQRASIVVLLPTQADTKAAYNGGRQLSKSLRIRSASSCVRSGCSDETLSPTSAAGPVSFVGLS
jgi:hypothetical protein